MKISEAFKKIATEYPAAKKTKLKGNSLANFIRSEVPKIIKKII